jgi:hypothetical protein
MQLRGKAGRYSVISGELQARGNSICLCFTGAVLPGGRDHCQITQIRPYKNKFGGGKLKAVSRPRTGCKGPESAQKGRENNINSLGKKSSFL